MSSETLHTAISAIVCIVTICSMARFYFKAFTDPDYLHFGPDGPTRLERAVQWTYGTVAVMGTGFFLFKGLQAPLSWIPDPEAFGLALTLAFMGTLSLLGGIGSLASRVNQIKARSEVLEEALRIEQQKRREAD